MIELKTFIEDAEGYITHLTVSNESAEEAWSNFQLVTSWFKADGAKPNKGFENKVVRSGGGQRKEDPVPADLKDHVPAHCGEPMEYKAAYKNPNTNKDVGAKFQCRKGKDCAQARDYNGTKYAHSMWEDAYRRELAEDGLLTPA